MRWNRPPSKSDPARIALAREHVRGGGEVVAEQPVPIERTRLKGRPSDRVAGLLLTFELPLAIFEADRDRLKAG